MDENAKIYIAGHKGLVGSAILRCLTREGYENIISREYRDLDLCDQSAVAEFFTTEKPDFVFLAAAKVGGIHANNTFRADFIYQNIQIQNNVIHHSYLNGVKKLLFLGSSCIYPKNCPQPMCEEHLLSSKLEYTNEPYAIAKIAGLRMCESYNLQYGTNFICAQPTNLYGPNDNYDLQNSHVLPALIRKVHLAKLLRKGECEAIASNLGVSDWQVAKEILDTNGISSKSLAIWGSGEPKREFLYSDDLADACVFLMKNIDFDDLKGDQREVRDTQVNIGSGKEISIKDLAFLIKETIDYDGDFEFDQSKPDGTMRKLLDTGKLNSLGWQSGVSLTEGLKLAYQDYQKI